MNGYPQWVKAPSCLQQNEYSKFVKETLADNDIHTVCIEARCPNVGYCWGQKTATFMLLGDVCTRNCKFCAVQTGNPRGETDPTTPERLADAVNKLELNYVVLTSVDRDDLDDGGATFFTRTIKTIHNTDQTISVEALIPDFQGDPTAISRVAHSGAQVIGHNIETVARLTPQIRDPRAGYDLSLSVLKELKETNPNLVTKSSLILGLGEELDEITTALSDLKAAGIDIVTLGQYLRPTEKQLPVKKYWSPEEFEKVENYAQHLGFPYVLAGPLVRSSYRAHKAYREIEKLREN